MSCARPRGAGTAKKNLSLVRTQYAAQREQDEESDRVVAECSGFTSIRMMLITATSARTSSTPEIQATHPSESHIAVCGLHGSKRSDMETSRLCS